MNVRKSAPYLFHGVTQSLCRDCDALIPAKVIEQNGSIYFRKQCLEHRCKQFGATVEFNRELKPESFTLRVPAGAEVVQIEGNG